MERSWTARLCNMSAGALKRAVCPRREGGPAKSQAIAISGFGWAEAIDDAPKEINMPFNLTRNIDCESYPRSAQGRLAQFCDNHRIYAGVIDLHEESKFERVGALCCLDVKAHICPDRRRCYRCPRLQPIPRYRRDYRRIDSHRFESCMCKTRCEQPIKLALWIRSREREEKCQRMFVTFLTVN